MATLGQLFLDVKEGRLEIAQALEQAKLAYYRDLDFAKIDHHRALRRGLPEVVYCEGKQHEHAARILQELYEEHGQALGTRATPELHERVRDRLGPVAEYHATARVIQLWAPAKEVGLVTVVSAGSSDIPVAEEAYVVSRALGNRTQKIYDVGVAGLHRLIDHLGAIAASNVVIAVAGMEGALPSVLAGLLDRPVLGVPTSVGYGSHAGGFVPLLAMLNSCSGLAVLNIDNGFGAAYFATLINLRCQ